MKTWLPNIFKSLLVQLEINLLKLLTMETLVVLQPVHVGLAKVTAILMLTAKVVSHASRPKQAKRPQESTSNPSKILG